MSSKTLRPHRSDTNKNFERSKSARTVNSIGLSCKRELVWTNWYSRYFFVVLVNYSQYLRKRGGEYIKKLRVTNITTQTKTFKYEPPVTPTFFMEFPEIIKIGPGLCKDIEIRFRPTENVQTEI